MELQFKLIKGDKDIAELRKLAIQIWNVHYPPIIGQKQVNYMLDQMYSFESLKEQIFVNKNIITGAYLDGIMAGYISYSKTGPQDFFIHKLYVNTEIHRKGIGKSLFDHIFDDIDFRTIRLTVNRLNILAVNFYFRLGFKIEKTIDIDIGEGFWMNDFVMLLQK
ncbi:MAG: GNAT family N-acetyltransferase [Ignavibacteria bacterium]